MITMASRHLPTDDKARFWRYTLLLSDVGREVMLNQFTVADLTKNLNCPGMEQRIRKDKQSFPSQIDLLYPPSGQPVEPDKFDITLLALVHRIVFRMPKAKLPLAPIDKTTSADLYRLRAFRNEIVHSPIQGLSELTFREKWTELEEILLRLGPTITGLKDSIDDLRKAPLDPAIKRLQVEIEHWKEKAYTSRGLESLMESTKDFLDDCVEDDVYVKTGAYQKARQVLEKEDILVISGLPGEGKTTMAQKLVMELSSSERCIVLDTPEEWVNVDTDQVQIDYIIIDDIFGTGALDQRLAKTWQPCLNKIVRRMKIAKFKTIITTRHYIFEEAKIIARYDSLFKTDKNIVHISSNDLSTEERTRILSAHVQKKRKNIQADQIKECIIKFALRPSEPTNGLFGFPQCVDMFVKNNNLFDKGSNFFSNPNQFFMDVLNDVKRDPDRDKFLALILLWARGSKSIFLYELETQAPSQGLQYIAKQFGFSLESGKTLVTIKQFLRHHKYDLFDYQPKTGEYKFSHNVIDDMVGLVLCKDYQQLTLEYSSQDFILEYVTTDDDKNTSEYFYVEEHEYKYLSRRLVEFMLRDLRNVKISSERHLKKGGFTHTCFFNNKQFVESFVIYAKDYCNKVVHTLVMTMPGYILGTEIANKDIDIYLPDYFILNDNTLLMHELIDQDVSWGPSGNKHHLEISLTVAVHKDATETAKMLLVAGAVATQETVFIAAVHENIEMITLLMRSNDSIKSSTILDIVEGNSPLIIAAKIGLLKSVECLVKNGADMRYRNNSGLCAFDMAVLSENTGVCILLINAGSPVNERIHESNQTPLHFASSGGAIEIVRLLLEHGPNVCLREMDHNGYCPIHCAADRGHTDVVEVLLNHDESLVTQGVISSADQSEMTVYHISVWKNNRELVRMLVNRGAKPETTDCFGRTPLHCAVLDDKVELVELLLPHSDPNATDKEGRTPLHCAASDGKMHLVELLLPHTDTTLTDKQGRTPLCAAMLNKHITVSNHLRLHPRHATSSEKDNNERQTKFCNYFFW